MAGIRPEVLEEVEDCIDRIWTFQKAHGRKIHKYFKRSQDGRDGVAVLERSGVPIPEDYRALYWNYNGIEPRQRLSAFQESVFLGFSWLPISKVIAGNQGNGTASAYDDPSMTIVFGGVNGIYLSLSPQQARDGQTPLVARMGVVSPRKFIAFDSTLALLRSTCAAQDAGILRYQDQYWQDPKAPARRIMPAEIQYDVKALWAAIRPFNRQADYWAAQVDGPIDWQTVVPQLPKAVWDQIPEGLKKLASTPPSVLHRIAEEEMRAAGVFESDDPEAILDARDEALWREAARQRDGKTGTGREE